MATQKILINGSWIDSEGQETFSAFNPATKEQLSDTFPISSWADCEKALVAATKAAEELRNVSGEKIADFLEAYAVGIESRKDELVEAAHLETALPKAPRLGGVELPRTINQLRLAAKAARDSSWKQPIIDTQNNIRTQFGSLGPVVVFGPNNFPFAFGSISGSDFASAIAAGNPVIAKAHPSHPRTTSIFAEEALNAVEATGLPAATVQMIYMLSNDDGKKLVSDPRVAATGFTGSQNSGVALKQAAEEAGNLIYLELGSVNPVVILPGALKERGDALATEFSGSCLMGAGQFCTNPGLVILVDGDKAQQFVAAVANNFKEAVAGTLLSGMVESGLREGIRNLREAGADVLAGDCESENAGFSYGNTLLTVSAEKFISNAKKLQREAFGNTSLIVVAKNIAEVKSLLAALEGNLTGCVYSDTEGSDDALYSEIESTLRSKVGRLLNDVMPTGVAVSPAMNHGGPFPASGHPGFTAVGMPGSISRYAALLCYDKVREHRLPFELKDKNPGGLWRMIDGRWCHGDVSKAGEAQ